MPFHFYNVIVSINLILENPRAYPSKKSQIATFAQTKVQNAATE